MKFLIAAVSLVLGLSGITVTAKRKMEPRIVAEHAGRNCCESKDGLVPPCTSKVYTIENPMYDKILVDLQCNPELMGPTFSIYPRVRQQVEVCPEIPVEVNCFILTWHRSAQP